MGRISEGEIAMHVSTISIVVNLLLSAFKLTAGILAHSEAMISDSLHSASDVFSTFIVMIGVKIAGKKSDKEHPYGHERMECVASVILAVMLFLTGLGIGVNGIKKIAAASEEAIVVPGALALFAAALSIILKEWLYWYTRAAAKKTGSGALMADAWHHRSDSLSSVGALIGILGARLGVLVLDPLASVIICLFIGKTAIEIFKDAMDKMVDTSCDDETVKKMQRSVMKVSGVKRIDDIRTRRFGSKVYVDIEIAAEGKLDLVKSHEIAENVHLSIEKQFPNVKHCMVHVNPLPEVEKNSKIRL